MGIFGTDATANATVNNNPNFRNTSSAKYDASYQYENATTTMSSNQTYTPNTNNNVNYYNPSNNVILSQNDSSRGKSNTLSDSNHESNTPNFNNSAALSTDQRSSIDQDQAAAFGDGLLTPSGEMKGLIPVLASAVAGYVVSYMLGSTQNQAFMNAGISGASYYISDGLAKWGGYNNEILSFLGSSALNAGALTYLGADIGLSIGTGLISSAAASATKYIMARPSGASPAGRAGEDYY